MKLAVIFPVLNQFDLTECAIDQVRSHSVLDPDIIAIDNASNQPFQDAYADKVVRLDKNIGVYPMFWEALKHTDADILAFFHTDLMVVQDGWDMKVKTLFENNPKLGLVGFVGSSEIDGSGGRGLGTTSNFQGLTYTHRNQKGEDKHWTGSEGRIHGRVSDGVTNAAVVDGCAMIFRRTVLEQLQERQDFPIHHFYDRLLSCEVREAGYTVAVLGIACDHISGQTVNQENAYSQAAQAWCEARNIPKTHNWDDAMYREAERQWLHEYRDIKHFIPCQV